LPGLPPENGQLADTTLKLQALLDSHRAGHPQAAERLISAAAGRLRALASRLLRAGDRLRKQVGSDDIVQGAVVKLLGALRECRPETAAEFLALSAQLIRREMADVSRQVFGRPGNHPRPPIEPLAGSSIGEERGPVDPSTPSADAVAAETWGRFWEQVQSLPQDQLAVFDLLFIHRLSQAEAAAQLGVSVSTIGKRWLAVRLKLGKVQDQSPTPG
jgi:RNA polymerase sigma factor (sigma-70 family)